MKSKLRFELDEDNKPVIQLEVINSDDLRDKVAKKFLERLGSNSNYCLIEFNTAIDTNMIATITPIDNKDLEWLFSQIGERIK